MKVYFELTCDFGHRWGDFLDGEACVPEVCPEGHEAVTLTKMPPVDQVQITIRPAGRLADAVNGRYDFENKVRIVVSDMQGAWEYQSRQVYSWREAEAIVRMFERRSTAQAQAIIERRERDERAI